MAVLVPTFLLLYAVQHSDSTLATFIIWPAILLLWSQSHLWRKKAPHKIACLMFYLLLQPVAMFQCFPVALWYHTSVTNNSDTTHSTTAEDG